MSTRPEPQPPDTDEPSISSALIGYTSVAPPPAAPEAPRRYRSSEVARLLGVFAALMLLFDFEGLHTWARRMEAGPAQSAWLSLLEPLQGAFGSTPLAWPRRAMVGWGEKLADAFGTGEDPLLVAGWVDADNAVDPTPAPTAPEPAPAEVEQAPSPPDDKVRVLLVGDSMIAGSLGSALTRALERDARYALSRATQSATGLAQPEVFDWMKVAPPLIERERPHFIICSLGANDGQSIRRDGQLFEFGSPAWRAEYEARAVALMRALTAGGAQVLWLGLPPMRQRRLSERAQKLNRLYASAARQVPGVEPFELGMVVSPGGEYATFASTRDGKPVRYRLDDGIHYSPAGARAIATWVVDWLEERSGRR